MPPQSLTIGVKSRRNADNIKSATNLQGILDFKEELVPAAALDVNDLHFRNVGKKSVGAVAEVQINIQDQGAPDQTLAPQAFHGNRHVIKETKPPMTVGAGVVAGGPQESEGRFPGQGRGRSQHGAPGGQDGHVIDVGLAGHGLQEPGGMDQKQVLRQGRFRGQKGKVGLHNIVNSG